jgi:hypothetical protein
VGSPLDHKRNACLQSGRNRAVPQLYRLSEAAALLGFGVTERSLRTEARRGRLQVTRLAGKLFVTADALAAMVATNTMPMPSRRSCPDADSQHAFTSAEHETTEEPSTLFSTERKKLAMAQAQGIVRQLKVRCRPTSPKPTVRLVARTNRTNSSSQK